MTRQTDLHEAEGVATDEQRTKPAARKAGQIVARGAKRWLVRWFASTSEGGKRVYHSKTIHGTRREAQKYLNTQLHNRDSGVYVAPTRTTLDLFLDDWLEKATLSRSARTVESYRWLLAKYVRPELGHRRLDSIRRTDVQDLAKKLLDRGLSPRTIRLALAGALSAAFADAIRLDTLAYNPCTRVAYPRQEKKEMRALSPAEVKRLRTALVGDRLAVLFDFLLATGCRPGEALGLRWADLDLPGARVAIRRALTLDADGHAIFSEPKTETSNRAITLPPSVVRALEAHRRAQAAEIMALGPDYPRDLDLVFANEIGLPLELRNVVRRHFKPALERAGLPATVRLYDLRHTVATQLLRTGISAKVAAERLGHSETRMTLDTYSHVDEGMQKQATERLERTLFR
jgi:integrase